MTDSDSDLSTPPATDDEMPVAAPAPKATKPLPQKKKGKKKANGNILSFFDKEATPPPRKKRAPSPPHEPVPEDNSDIAFIVMFRSRFSDAFPPKCPHMGPQDLERGVSADLPTPEIESLLCALLGLVNNRKKPIEKGNYGRALEEAILGQRSQWPRAWEKTNPLNGGRSFNTMSATERLVLLKALVLWSLNQSEIVNNMIKETYKARTIKDRADTNIPLSVQPWGKDGDKRRYWLVEGQDDTNFRVYRESNIALKTVTWWSVAGSIDDLRVLAKKLQDDDGTREAQALAERILNAIPRFEATEEKRKRREYRLQRKAAFARPDPGFSLYEGRTRGKRMRYTFSDNEDEDSEAGGARRSTRNSGMESSAPAAPTVTASGRQVRSRATGMYGESLLSGQTTEGASPATGDYERSEGSEEPGNGRSRRAAQRGVDDASDQGRKRKNIDTYNSDDDEEEDATSWDGGDDDDEADPMDLDDEEDDSGEEASDEEQDSLVVRLKIGKGSFKSSPPASTAVPEDNLKTEGAVLPSISTAQPPNGMDAARRQPVLATAPAPAATDAPLPQPLPPPAPLISSIATNGIVLPQEPAAIPPIAPVEALPLAASDSKALPPLGAMFRAPTPPYAVQEEPKPQEQPVPFAASKLEAPRSPQSLAPTLPVSAPTPAANWQ